MFFCSIACLLLLVYVSISIVCEELSMSMHQQLYYHNAYSWYIFYDLGERSAAQYYCSIKFFAALSDAYYSAWFIAHDRVWCSAVTAHILLGHLIATWTDEDSKQTIGYSSSSYLDRRAFLCYWYVLWSADVFRYSVLVCYFFFGFLGIASAAAIRAARRCNACCFVCCWLRDSLAWIII